MGENTAALKDMAAQLADMLRVQGQRGTDAWSQLHGKLAEVAAAAGDDPRTAGQALLKVAKDASSPQALMRTLEGNVSKANLDLLKYILFLVADELNMTPLGDSEPVHMLDGDKNFCEGNVGRIINCSPELCARNAPYALVSIVGAQSSGKSYLLNCLFGTKFPVMNAKRRWSQTTRGIMMSRCIGPSLLLLDVEGFDGRENGQYMPIVDIGREQGGGTILFRTIFQQRTKIERGGLTKILVVLRSYNGETPLEILRSDVQERLQKTWESVNVEKFKDYIEVDVFGMPDKESPKFPKEVIELRRLLSQNSSAKVPASSFTASARIIWDAIKQNKKLDIPSHQVLIASLYCRRLVKDTLKYLDLLEDYKLLKVEECPSRFKQIAYAILEGTTTKYDLETKMYDHDTTAKEHQYMVENLYKIFKEDSRELIWKRKEYTLDNFKDGLERENIQSMNEAEAFLHGSKIVDECVKEFMSSFEDRKVFDSDHLSRICRDLREELQADTALHILKIKEERPRNENERATLSSLILQATETGVRAGNLVTSVIDIIFGANGN